MDTRPVADMPMKSRDGRFVLAFNGELYDHQRHRHALTRYGWSFSTRSDTETILAALAIHGPDILDELNGMFALAIYDAHEHHLLLARDHAGIKPLYVSTFAGMATFCSELDTLLASPAKVPRDVDPVALVEYLDFGHVFAPRSLVRNVELLEPGERRLFFGDGRQRRRFDRLRSEPIDGGMSEDEAEEALGASLRGAVSRQSQSDTDVGFLLSGGIDSRLLAHFGAEIANKPINVFSIGNEPPLHNELPEAIAEARLLQARHRSTMLSSTNCEELFSEAIAAIHEPISDEGLLPSLLVSRLARETVSVALSGEGADELLFGYDYRHTTVDWSAGAPPAPDSYRDLYREFGPANFDVCFPSAAAFRAESRAVAWTSVRDVHMEWVRAIELHTYLPFVLLKTDRASMFHSLEVRVPYLDKEVIRTALRIDPQTLYDHVSNHGKRISRRLLKGRGTVRPKRGFTAPVEHWLRGPLRSALETTVERLAGLSTLSVDQKVVRRLAQEHWAGRGDAGMALWRLVILDHWAAKAGL